MEFPAPTEYAPEVFVLGAGTIFDLERNADIGADTLPQVNNASWWSYDRALALIFWRWNTNKEIVNVREVTPLWIDYSKMPHFQRPQKAPQLEDLFKVAEKLWNVRMKYYIWSGPVLSLSHFFHVAKGEPGPDSDIRRYTMVPFVVSTMLCGLLVSGCLLPYLPFRRFRFTLG